jgi:hypothetical protein
MATRSDTPTRGELRGLSHVQGIAHDEHEPHGYFDEQDQPVIFALIMLAIAVTVWWFV